MTSNSKVILEDTREKPKAVELINAQLESLGYTVVRTKLYSGDYQLLNSPLLVVDRKQSMNELATNLTTQHERFHNEIERANEIGIKVIILCEHGENIKTKEDVRFWHNPRLEHYPRAPKGITLYKTMNTMEALHDVKFLFCDKKETGLIIASLLEEGVKDG